MALPLDGAITLDNQNILHFGQHKSRSTEDRMPHTLNTTLDHTDKDFYANYLFIDFSSAVNIVIPPRLVNKLVDLGIHSSYCNWILDFLIYRTPVSVSWQKHFRHNNLQDRHPTGKCAESPATLTICS